MKKLLATLLIGLFAVSLMPMANAGAATLSLASTKSSYQVGDILRISVNINSGANELQVIRAEFTYPADLMQFESFSLASLFPMRSPGESTGNGKISVGGFRTGVATSQSGLFGTASFKVLKSGTAQIVLTAGSKMVTPEPKDIYSGGNSLSLTFGSKVMPEEKPAPKPETPKAPEALIAPTISSSTQEESAWSNNNNPSFNWTKPASALGYALKLSRDQFDDIGQEITTNDNSYSYQSISDGIWTFHLKAKYAGGFSPIAYFTVKIDTTAPSAPQPSIESLIDSSGKNIYQIFFAATDELSGVNSYLIKFDNNSFQSAASPYTLNASEENARTVTVKAIDNAGNETIASLEIADYITSMREQQVKKALFDIQAQTTKQTLTYFYLALAAIVIILIIIIVSIIWKKRRKS